MHEKYGVTILWYRNPDTLMYSKSVFRRFWYYYLAKIAKLCIDKNYWDDLDNVKKKCEPTLTIKRT